MSEETRPRFKPVPDPRAGTTTNTDGGLTISVPAEGFEMAPTGPYTVSGDQSSPGHQREAIMIQLLRIRESRCDEIAFMKEAAGHTYGEVVSTGVPLPQRFMAVDAHFLLIAIGATLRTSQKLLSKTGDHRLADARREFEEAFPHAEDLRDIAEHLEAYAIGEGWLQSVREPEETRVRSDSASFWMRFDERFDPDSTIWINFSDSRRMDLRAAADRAIELATVMEEIEVEYAERHGHGPWV